MRGWETAFGSSYEAALADGRGLVGRSVVFAMDTAVGTEPIMNVRGVSTFPTGWTGFAIVVPEPSAIALGLVGVGALLLLRRRRKISNQGSCLNGGLPGPERLRGTVTQGRAKQGGGKR